MRSEPSSETTPRGEKQEEQAAGPSLKLNYIFTGIRDRLVCFQGKGCEEANAPLASDIRH